MKKILILLLAMLMVLSLAACGGGGDKDTPSTNDDAPDISQQHEDKTPEADPVEDEPVEDKQADETEGKSNSKSNGVVLRGSYTNADEYTDKAIEIMLSLGKTIEDEQIVYVYGHSDGVAYMVYLYNKEDGTLIDQFEYTFYVKESDWLYEEIAGDPWEGMETDDAALMTKVDYFAVEGASTFELDYQNIKELIDTGLSDAVIIE